MPAPTILCADDDRNFCQILARALREEGYSVETAHDGEAAVERVLSLRPSLVIMDVLLPKRDGFAALETLRAQGCETPVLLLSGCTFTPQYHERAQVLRASETLTKPVPLRELLEKVAQHLNVAPAGARPKPAARAREAVRQVARAALASDLEGTLEEVTFPALLHHLHGLRAAGVLELAHGKKKKQVQLRDGHPIAVRSNLVNETLGNLLVASGRITWDVMHESLRRVQSGEGLQGQILVAMHMLDPEDLAAALHNQAEEKLFEMFSWRTGRYRFLRGARLKTANTLTLKRSTANVILDGVQLRTPLEVVDAFLAGAMDRVVVPGESPFYRFQEIDLDPQAEAVLEGVDGTRRLRELEGLTEAARRTLYALLTLEMLELRDESTGARQLPFAHGRARRAPDAPAPELREARAPEPQPAARRPEPRPEPARQRPLPPVAPRTAPERPAPVVRPIVDRVVRATPPRIEPERPAAPTRPSSALRSQPAPPPPPAAAAPPPQASARPAAPPRPEQTDRPEPDEALRSELAAMAGRLRGRDYFEILGVERHASDEAIRHAYTDLAKRTHPDRFSGSGAVVTRLAEEVFGLISRAYEVVGERTSRLEYLRDEASRARDQADLEEGHRALRAELEFQKGEAALRGRHYDAALAHFEKAVEAYPDEGEYRAYLGWALYLTDPEGPGRIHEALQHVLHGRKLAPDREKPYLFLGRLYKADNRMKIAEKMFTRAVQLDPDCVEALRELRLIHMRREKSKGLVRRILRR